MATIYKRRDRWRAQIRVKYRGHILHAESQDFDRKADAEDWARQREAEVKSKENLERLKTGVLTVGRLIKEYQDDQERRREQGKAVKYGRTKRTTLDQMRRSELAELDATTLTKSQILAHLRRREDSGAGPATLNNDLVWLRTVLRWARSLGNDGKGYPVSLDPLQDARVTAKQEHVISRSQERDRRPTPAELQALDEFFASRDGRAQIPMQDIMWFAIHSARRQAEITRLLWTDLNEDAGTVLVRGLKHPRAQNVNKVAKLTQDALEIIQRQPKGDERIFPYDSKSVGAAFTRACRVLGIEDLRFHDLRHEACSRLAIKGYTIAELRLFSLHDGLQALQRYIDLRPEDVPER